MAMTLEEARAQVLDAFDPACGTYYHVRVDDVPHYRDKNFIDGLSWVSILWGACLKRGDTELAAKAEAYCRRIVQLTKDEGWVVRNFQNHQVDENWRQCTSHPGTWIKTKENYYDGPGGLQFAINCGADIKNTLQVCLGETDGRVGSGTNISVGFATWWGCAMGGWFGWLYRKTLWGKGWGERYINPHMLSYLVAGKKPPESLRFLAEGNPFYSYIFGKKLDPATRPEWYPNTRRFLESEEIENETSSITPLSHRKPEPWVFKGNPYLEYTASVGTALRNVSYTPIWVVAGDYLQATL